MNNKPENPVEQDQTLNEPQVVRSRRPASGPDARYVWLLVLLVIVFFVLGVLMVISGLLGGSIDPLPGPTAFTLTPQL